MIQSEKGAKEIREYIILNKFRHIAGNEKLTDKEVFQIADMLDSLDYRGVFRELNEELKKLLARQKRR